MPQKKADATWSGTVMDGEGTVSLDSGAFGGAYTFASRMEGGGKTNPDELIAAGLASCFNMALSAMLSEMEFVPESLDTQATVTLEQDGDEFTIPTIDLEVVGTIPDIGEETFREVAEQAKATCPVSKALGGPEISLNAGLS